ncbi:MAG: hypothetical protein QOK47_1103, partial [Actinomycetota bacterium]|nr:hypothetical protein [Actinomycetota bacterium]
MSILDSPEVIETVPVHDETPVPAKRPSGDTKKRRRPSGEPPALPRPLLTSGRYWLGLTLAVLAAWIVLFVVAGTGSRLTK